MECVKYRTTRIKLKGKVFSDFKNGRRENKTVEEYMDMEYISLHRFISNAPSDTEVNAEHQL